MAIQVLGGAGYTKDYILEQFYRDQRLNPIHEGAEAIHGLDLLGRKVVMQGGGGYRLFVEAVSAEIDRARDVAGLEPLAEALAGALAQLSDVTPILVALQGSDPDRALANATIYLDVFGKVTAAWMWLRQAAVATRALALTSNEADADYYRGKLQAARYYFQWELPGSAAQFTLLRSIDTVPYDMQESWFQ